MNRPHDGGRKRRSPGLLAYVLAVPVVIAMYVELLGARVRPQFGGRSRHLSQLLLAVVVFVAVCGLLAQGAAAVLDSGMGRVAGQLLGVSGTRRYLVLAQNPAELRPAGGYAGTVGIVAFNKLRPVERSFVDVYEYDLRPGLPHVEPPEALANHLLGTQSWQLADSAWSPDFPTAAANALRLYTLESGDTDIDGVIALNTYAVDRLLEATGPIYVPEYGVTVAAGDVTMTAMRLTRGVSDGSGTDRKAFLSALADWLVARMTLLLPTDWLRVADALWDVGQRRDMLVWFTDPAAEKEVAQMAIGGAVRQDQGDYLYVVEANVEPSSKYNLVIDRSDTVTVALDVTGQAATTLHIEWRNHVLQPGEPYASLRSYSRNKSGQYGAWLRVLTPTSSVVNAASAAALDPISGIEETAIEAGRQSLGNYLLIGGFEPATLDYSWVTPGIATRGSDGTWTYRLTIQKQPGLRSPPLAVSVALPAGASILSTGRATAAADGTVKMQTVLERDVTLEVSYTLP